VKPAPRAAGAVVFRRSERGIQLLLLRAYKNWDFPKGLVEPGENELDAAKREVREETGLAELNYLAQTDAEKIELPVSPELGRPEHHEYRWVSFDEAEGLLPPRLAIVLDWAKKTIS
jgi:bis(5'-nucleosidyl)-tetraphosphatase